MTDTDQQLPSSSNNTGGEGFTSPEDELDWGTLCSPNGLEHELMTYAPLKKLLNTIIKKVSSQDKKLSSVDDKVSDAAKQALDANEKAKKLKSQIDASEQEKMGDKETNDLNAKTEAEKHEKRHKDLMDKIGDLEKQLQDLKKQNEDLKHKNSESEDKLKRLVGDALKTMQTMSQIPPQPTNTSSDDEKRNITSSSNRRPFTPEENKRNIQDVEVFSTPEVEKTVQLYKPADDEDNSTLQSVILSLPKHGKVTQFDDEASPTDDMSNTDTNTSNKPKSRPTSTASGKRGKDLKDSKERPPSSPQKKINFAPAAVTDPNHRINFSADTQTEGVVDPFKYNVYDVKNDLDRAQVSRVKGVLLSQLNDLQRELDDAKKKEKDDVDLLLDQILGIKNQVNSINKKLDLAQKLKGQDKNTSTDNLYEEGLLDVQLDEGKNVKVFIPPKTEELDSSVTDSINELLGKIDYLENRLADATRRIDDLENRPQPAFFDDHEELEKPEKSNTPFMNTRETVDASTSPFQKKKEDTDNRTGTPSERPESSSDDFVSNKDLKKLEKKLMYYITTHDMSNDLNNQIQELIKQLESVEDRLAQKCDIASTPNHQQFKDIEDMVLKKADREEVHNMIEKLKNDSDKQPTIVQRPFSPQEDRNPSSPNTKVESSGIDQADLKKIKDALNNLSSQLSQLSKMKADKIDVFKELSEKKEQIDRLDQTKSDANIVARKAEREYVDSLFNKLKKDLENSISMTNTHTADLLAKDLEFLKRLIEDKADSDEIRRIKEYLNQAFDNKTEKDGDGLASSQAFKCLSCNRALKGMKMRPQSLNFDNFISHLPPPKQKVNPRKQFLNDSLTKSSVQIPSSILDDGRKNRSAAEHLPELKKSGTAASSNL
ncbi:hypothetical protein NAEGRDRAFT_58590 [Naegleria gruberi]|uniref:Uncharacterized protein n=1 Tax=Naegleria gruberi TaxID=5762 RepID=D2VLD6_NAEGR|nr:uncharacterized protein NAEGRDRAFT_58590 [Naegleria gruberi]EFC42290.1 hypothetical protein NAEGRDRAFT_58590 [Naegleria gruberi]|eukprot:XP_002675034.1 hypothetical protein NAEGRDRAFT_58590 [Naegleria gruberi strain NEG-M]